MEDYAFFVEDTAHFCARLDVLTELRGKAVISAWKEQVLAGQVREVVHDVADAALRPGLPAVHATQLRPVWPSARDFTA
jgi:tRNA 2-selenouridine synthase